MNANIDFLRENMLTIKNALVLHNACELGYEKEASNTFLGSFKVLNKNDKNERKKYETGNSTYLKVVIFISLYKDDLIKDDQSLTSLKALREGLNTQLTTKTTGIKAFFYSLFNGKAIKEKKQHVETLKKFIDTIITANDELKKKAGKERKGIRNQTNSLEKKEKKKRTDKTLPTGEEKETQASKKEQIKETFSPPPVTPPGIKNEKTETFSPPPVTSPGIKNEKTENFSPPPLPPGAGALNLTKKSSDLKFLNEPNTPKFPEKLDLEQIDNETINNQVKEIGEYITRMENIIQGMKKKSQEIKVMENKITSYTSNIEGYDDELKGLNSTYQQLKKDEDDNSPRTRMFKKNDTDKENAYVYFSEEAFNKAYKLEGLVPNQLRSTALTRILKYQKELIGEKKADVEAKSNVENQLAKLKTVNGNVSPEEFDIAIKQKVELVRKWKVEQKRRTDKLSGKTNSASLTKFQVLQANLRKDRSESLNPSNAAKLQREHTKNLEYNDQKLYATFC
jgi:hypothetical protein